MITFINIVSIVLEFLISVNLFKKISQEKESLLVSSVVFLVAFGIQCLNNFYFLAKSPIVVLISVFCLFLLSFMYRMTFKSRIWSSFFLFIIGGLAEITIAFSSTLIFDVDTLYTQTDPFLLALCTISAKFLSYVIIRVLKFKKGSQGMIPFSISYSFIPLPLATLLIVILLYSCCYEIDQSIFKFIALISSLLLIGANIFMLNLIERNNDYTKTKAQLEFTKKHILQQTLHYEELYQCQVDLKKIRHDLKNQLICILGLLQSGENEKAIITIKKDLAIINEPENLFNSGNPVLDSILHSKIETAKSMGIQTKASIKLNVPINIDSIELGIIVGNALDNAIDAVSQIVDSDYLCKEISINILAIAESISIEIINSVKKEVDILNLSSTKSNKALHGMGIKIMRSLVEKYNGDLYFLCQDNQFVANIIISNVSL